MKLAEALKERSDLNSRIAQLRQRIESNCLVQEGEAPVESPDRLMEELDGCIDRLNVLMAAINRTNCALRIDGRTITELIAERDCLKLRLSAYRGIAEAAGMNTLRARAGEIKILSAVDVSQLQRKADRLARQLREVDNLLQAANWQLDLIEE